MSQNYGYYNLGYVAYRVFQSLDDALESYNLQDTKAIDYFVNGWDDAQEDANEAL